MLENAQNRIDAQKILFILFILSMNHPCLAGSPASAAMRPAM